MAIPKLENDQEVKEVKVFTIQKSMALPKPDNDQEDEEGKVFILNAEAVNVFNKKKNRLPYLLIGVFFGLLIGALLTYIHFSRIHSEMQSDMIHKLQRVRYKLKHVKRVRVCIPNNERTLCNSLDLGGSQALCVPVESRIDCAIKLGSGAADVGVFSDEETLVLGQQQPADGRVVATIRDVAKMDAYSFETVAIVSASHTGGLEGLKGGKYCHPGTDSVSFRWSPRVLKTFEYATARSDRCPGAHTADKTAEELELEALHNFFSSGCRPGPWAHNTTLDEKLKAKFPSLCELCGTNNNCQNYTIDMGVAVAGVSNDNSHIKALQCLRNAGNHSVAYVAWQHAKEFFTIRNPELAPSYALLCPDGTTQVLSANVLALNSTPCAFVRQPWNTIVASTSSASTVLTSLRTWWPSGASPGGNSWQMTLFNGIVGGSNARVVFDETLPSPANYTASIRNLTSIDSSSSCLPATRWCTLSNLEQTKCMWVRSAAFSLGIQPAISCQQRASVFSCLEDIQNNQADFIASSSNYGYIAREHYKLSPIKLVQNSRSSANSFSRVAAFVKETTAQHNVTRFENLRGRKACFPEYGGIAYVAFVRTAHERGIISASECDYAKAVGEFFSGACAPGAVDASHAISATTYNATDLCSVCKPRNAVVNNTTVATSAYTCSWDYTNMYFGNNGTLACLADPDTDVAFLQTQDIAAHLTSLNLQANQYRALCRNNTLAATTGVNIDDGCLLAYVVDAEVLTRKNDKLRNAISAQLDTLDLFFGYNAEASLQLINLEIFSPFNDVSDLLFKDTAIGFSEPTLSTDNEPSRNYIELFNHLETCNNGVAGLANKNIYSIITMVVMAIVTRFVVY